MAPDQAHILVSKVALFENVLIWLLMRELQHESDPASAATNLAANFRRSVEANAAKQPNEPEAAAAQLIGLEILDSFFDRVRAAVQN